MTNPANHLSSTHSSSEVVSRLQQFAGQFDRELDARLVPSHDVPPELLEAMRYSALAPGKRIRPFLVVRCCELVGGQRENAWAAASAIECVHAFSLIHDDLPAMDDDDLRRGRPTCHKRFGEATAILAGDALLALSFELLTRSDRDATTQVQLVETLAKGIGWNGMIGGQAADVLGQDHPPELARAKYIHERKTARLFETSCRLGALSGQGTEDQVADLQRFGQMLGRAFQIADDLLDLTASTEVLGKQAQKDKKANKQTFPQCIGIEQSRLAAQEATQAALSSIASFGPQADDLRALATYVTHRDY